MDFSSSEDQNLSYHDLLNMLNQIPEPMAIMKVNSGDRLEIVEANDLLEKLTGYSVAELKTMALDSLLTENSLQSLSLCIQQVRLARYTDTEVTQIHKDGTKKPSRLTLSYVKSSNKPPYMIALIKDITYQREIEALLAMTDKQLESLFDYNPDLIFKLDQDGKFTNVNPIHEQILSYKQDELLGTHFIDRVYEEDVPLVLAHYEHVLRKESVRLDMRVLNKQDEIVYLDLTAFPVISHNEVVGMICIARDCTEEKRTRRKLRESEQMYRSLFENNIDSVITFDIDGNFLKMNEAAEKLLGYTFEEVKGSIFLRHIIPEQQEKIFQYFQKALEGESIQYETVMYNRAEEERYIHVTLIPMKIDGEIIGVHSIGKDLTEQYSLQESLKHMIFQDYLTGLSNPHKFHYDLNALIESDQPYFFSLFFLDLDRFKLVNDSFGHSYGDALLQKVAYRLKSIIPNSGTVYRYGGDEFIIILRDTTIKKTKSLAEQIIKELSEPYVIDQLEIVLTPSIGISVYPLDGIDEETLIRKADNAMYNVKRIARGNYQFHHESLKQKTLGNIRMDSSLRKGIQQDEFSLMYQPQIDATTNKIVGAEALLRWHSRDLGPVSPNVFIPLAEETGLIIPIGEWVLKQACNQILSWKEEGIVLPIAINLSIRQFYYHNFIPSVEKIIQKTDINPSLLHMEITESMAIDQEFATKVLQQLKNIGVKIAIDDFGTGYSSLSHLKKFPFDYLKIDQSFISDLDHDKEGQDMISIITMLAKKFNMRTIAEGVETEKHVDLLKKYECDIMQGFFYSRPLPPSEFTQWKKNWEIQTHL
ncbi:diguanylate cyclase (GGDEF)-like protein/PAS domain S-box-containing protein [Gracilibacillus halotolerans]|uniref:Diguanylate cyclase (GGDEF)-like protein/PAS domain S-box-containing protein n=1 Tax=Gracilibacillus halotolerans TaxID=74386 RepID=A0A841RPL4_9BACI|nr:bifunctional diguanylate cyclase/phosphodiesterase [Gracilibacillus halotolerans]MBB6513563.1 diguanylate cyclase (GGDEF)-like protein/PAS domain S-box-containing protein [Gracilibacillus halotolerans]